MKKTLIAVFSVILIAASIYLVIKRYNGNREVPYSQDILEKTYRNYGNSVRKSADKYDLPPEYLLSLIALECSGRKLVPHRFEPRVFDQLKKVRNGEIPMYDNVTTSDLKGLNNVYLKKLASSWGPFQLMGYKSFELNSSIKDINGPKSIEIGIKWINNSYGRQLRDERYQDAFHIHNTGKKYPLIGPPRTYHKHYVPMGMRYMEAFKLKMAEEETLTN